MASGFLARHLGTTDAEASDMARALGHPSVDSLIAAAVPASLRRSRPMVLPDPRDEAEALGHLKDLMGRNRVARSLIGLGYADCVTPAVIRRNILENPGWYTAYTPYQAEISQGRLEACLNFQTLVTDLTGLDVANASLLDEATAAAEAMALCHAQRPEAGTFLVARSCHPQTLAVLCTRAEPLGIRLVEADPLEFAPDAATCGALFQIPDTDGALPDLRDAIRRVRDAGALVVVATDPLYLVLHETPGELGADIAVGNTQRFGVPLGFGGPHAAFLAVRDELKRRLPGRLVGVSRDADGRPAYRLALQTREQHIRREKATSNICTAQVLLAVLASMYAVYHGPEGLRAMAARVRELALRLARAVGGTAGFDTVKVPLPRSRQAEILAAAEQAGFNLRAYDDGAIGITLDERSTPEEVTRLAAFFGKDAAPVDFADAVPPVAHPRQADLLPHDVFRRHHTETEMMRYLHRLEGKDLALNTSMIPLGSCTMKLNAAAEMLPVTWPEVGGIHPFAPPSQWQGYAALLADLEAWLAAVTGFDAVSLQPNAGSQGEYAGLLAIRSWHLANGHPDRDVCLIPTSAHGTNPASAAMAGLKVVAVACDSQGNVDLADLEAKAEAHADRLAAVMVTYPSTHGVFEEGIRDIARIVHARGGQVYLDGANLNAQVGLCSPAELGADVCHLNLHKTFCIPHGGGGPGVGPIAVAAHLAPHLPGHPFHLARREGAVSAAPYGSASILVISWMYIAMTGAAGLTEATKRAILHANHIARRLEPYFPVLYRGPGGLVAHECILDLRPFKASAGIEVEDVAKRLIDYGFHAPTMSWPVPGTLMVEPTESESLAELDRFCDAMIAIHGEIQSVVRGEADPRDNVLKHAPHPAATLLAETWSRPYSRESAAYPAPWTRQHKYWPPVSRIDNVHGDRHLVCTCPTVEDLAES
jgi:glycine dehydrogenase